MRKDQTSFGIYSIECQREGRVHDYRAKAGVEASFIVAREDAPAWAQDRQALWNAAEAREVRRDGIVAREWELALPHELDGAGRRALAEGFARELVGRYGVAADVAIHAPHREGDQRNWHAHVLTTTRALGPEGLGDKTRVLDVKQTGGPEIAHMRERWAEMQNHALERHGHADRVDHRSLVAQRETALAHSDELAADTLDRAPEVKLGPVVSGIERRESRAAERDSREYVPLTERGAQVHEARAARSLFAELTQFRAEVRERAELARETYTHVREEGADRIRAGLAALRAAAQRQGIGQGLSHGREDGDERDRQREPEREASTESIKERLGRIMGREAAHAREGPAAGLLARREDPRDRERHHGTEAIRERLGEVLGRARPLAQREEPAAVLPAHGQEERERTREAHELDPIRERLREVLDRAKPVERHREEPAAERHEPRHERGHGHSDHEDERDEDTRRHRDRGHGHGL